MRIVAADPIDVQEFIIVGHVLRVFPAGEGRWEVTVDGEEVRRTCASTYEAWAVGVAESYRRGKKARRAPTRD
jgi:hypothetical protein